MKKILPLIFVPLLTAPLLRAENSYPQVPIVNVVLLVNDKEAEIARDMKALEKALEQLKSKMASRVGDTLIEKAVDVNGVRVLTARLDGADAKTLRETMDKVKDKLGTVVAVLASVTSDGKVQLAAGVSRDLTSKIKAGDVVNLVAQPLGGKGGGKPDMAMAGAQSAEGLDVALQAVEAYVQEHLG